MCSPVKPAASAGTSSWSSAARSRRKKFEQQVEALRAALVRHQVDAAIGSFWQSLVEDLPAFLREADDRMYREKERQKRAARPSV